MEWSDVAETVGKVAPVLGSALAGPAGGAVGGLVARALGVTETPEALAGATQNTEQRAELLRIENEHKREVLSLTLNAQAKQEAEQTVQLQATQETMRAELGTQGWFKSGWRPAVGWVMAYAFAALATGLTWTMITDPSQFPSIVDAAIALIVVMGPVLGLNLHERTKTYQIKAGQRPTTFMDAIRRK